MRNIGATKYRIILGDLSIKFLYQGKTDLNGIAQLERDVFHQSVQTLKEEEKANITVVTKVYDQGANHVADVTSTWQLKEWSNVKTKL